MSHPPLSPAGDKMGCHRGARHMAVIPGVTTEAIDLAGGGGVLSDRQIGF